MANDIKGIGRGGLGALFLTIFIDLVGFSIIFPLVPAILQHYIPLGGPDSLLWQLNAALRAASGAAGEAEAGQVLSLVLFGGLLGSVFSILQFVSSPVWGRLSDRMGRRRVLLITTALSSLGYLVWFFSGNFWIFISARVITGLMAGNISVASAAVADLTSKSGRTSGMAVLGIGFATGFMVGPAIGGAASLIDIPAQLPFLLPYGVNPFSGAALVALLLGMVNFAWIYFRLPETLPQGLRTSHAISANPIANLHMEKGPARTVTFINFAYLLAFSGMEFTLTFLALERFNFGPKDNIAIFLVGGVAMTLVQALVSRGAGRGIGEKGMTVVGLATGLCGMVILASAGCTAFFFTGIVIKAVGMALVSPSLLSMVSLYTPADRQGMAMGTLRAAGSLARAFGPLFASVLYWGGGSFRTYLLGAGVLLLPLVMASRLPRREVLNGVDVKSPG